MKRFQCFALAIGLLAASAQSSSAQAFSGGMPAGFACVGNCGTSAADGVVTLAPLGGSQYGWISTANGIVMDPLGIPGTTDGTVMTSPFFAAAAGQIMSFRFNYVSSDGGDFTDYAWVRLLSIGGPQVLFTARSEPVGNTVPGLGLPGLSPGVLLSPASTVVIPGAPNFTPLGGYNNNCWDAGCGYTGWIRAQYTIPTTGNYQLEFGVVNLLDQIYDSALAFDFGFTGTAPPQISENEDEDNIASTPEPSTWLLMASGLTMLGIMSRRRRA